MIPNLEPFNVSDFSTGRDDRHTDHSDGIAVTPMRETTALATAERRFGFDTRSDAWGYLCGCVPALGASLSFAAAWAGTLNGQTLGDLILTRFGVAGIVLMPLLPREAISADTRDVIRHVNAFGSSGVDAEVTTLWQHLAHLRLTSTSRR